MKLLQLLNEIEVPNIHPYIIKVKYTTHVKTVLVYPKDLGEEFTGITWYEATEACRKLHDGKWRLPYLEELEAMYKQLHKQGKGNFKSEAYWSRDESGDEMNADGDLDCSWVMYFDSGGMDNHHLKNHNQNHLYNILARPVRSLNSTT